MATRWRAVGGAKRERGEKRKRIVKSRKRKKTTERPPKKPAIDVVKTKPNDETTRAPSYDAYVDDIRSSLLRRRANLPKMRASLEAKRATRDGLTNRWQIRDRRRLDREIETIEREIKSLENECDFEKKVDVFDRIRKEAIEPIVVVDAAESATKVSDETTRAKKKKKKRRKFTDPTNKKIRSSRATAEDDGDIYRKDVLEDELRDLLRRAFDVSRESEVPLYVLSGDHCPQCEEGTMRDGEHGQIKICDKCGNALMSYDNSKERLGYAETDAYDACTVFHYRRDSHFEREIRVSQGNESTNIPDNVQQQICKYLHEKMGITRKEDITTAVIRSAMKQLGLRRFYENKQLIHSLLTGVEPPRLTPDMEETLFNMFSLIQKPFEMYKDPDRVNFLSYPYVLQKLLEHLGITDRLDKRSLLKGSDKLYQQDLCFKKIADHLGLRFKHSC